MFSLPIAASISSASAVPSISVRQISTARFLQFSGLKASQSLVTQSVPNRRSRFARGGRIACEAHDTTAAVEEMKLVKYVLENSAILKTLTVIVNYDSIEYDIFKELLKIPRCSTTCQVVVI